MRLHVLLFPLALAQSATNQAGILGRDDLAFARKLHEAGFDDLAQRMCKAVMSAGGRFTPDEVVDATILGFEAETAEAADLDDQTARKDRLNDILSRAEVFAKTLPDGPKSERLNQALASAQQSFAETLLNLMQAEADPAKAVLIAKDADKYFAVAEDGLAKKIELEQEIRAQTTTDEELENIENKLIRDSYSLARMYYLHSLLLKGNEVKRRVMLHQALDSFGEFELDWGGYPLAYEAGIYEGLCRKELGEDDKALEAFDYALSVRETFGPTGPDGRYPIPPETADAASQAVQQKLLFLKGKKDWASALAAADDFFKTTPEPFKTTQGLAIMASQADAQKSSGDFAAAMRTAEKLVDMDPHGPWGAFGREILSSAGQSGSVDPSKPDLQLRIAETLMDKREYHRAHVACRQARTVSAGTPVEADIGAESYVIDGVAYMREGLKAEACLAYDAAVRFYPKGAKAPDALWRSINAYQDLYEEERRAFYKKATGERMTQFGQEYPKDPKAVSVSLVQGRQFEAEGDFDRASQVYQAVAPTSPAYGEAQFLAGNCLVKQATAQSNQNKLADADTTRKKALPILAKAQDALEKQLHETLDNDAHARLASLAFAARATQASLLLAAGPGEAAKVEKILESVETTFPDDADKIAKAWGLRIRALQAQGKLQDAVNKLDALLRSSPDAPAVGSAAGSLARALDQSALDMHTKDPASRQAEAMWQDAARLYALSVKGQVTGKESANPAELEAVGRRLYALGLQFESAPADADSFLDWMPQRLGMPEMWEQIAATFEAMLATGDNYRAELFLGRVRGLQAHWKDAAIAYSKLFDLEPLMEPAGKRFDRLRRQEKPELVPAYIEWGMTELKAGAESGDKERLGRAGDIFEKALGNNNLEAGSKLWWRAKRMQVETMIARGQYDVAAITLRDIERTTQDYDQGKYGEKARLLQLKAEVEKRVAPQKAAAPQKPAAPQQAGAGDKPR